MHPLVLLAKSAVESYIKERKVISPPQDLSRGFLEKKSGTFVTINKNDQLRGCIGTYLPIKESIAKEVIFNAIAAASEDYRFGPVQKEELPYLSYTIYILSMPEQVESLEELGPRKYGIIVRTIPIMDADKADVVFDGRLLHKSALLLPGLKGIDTTEKQVLIACQKGGIDPSKEKLFIYRFTTEKYASKK